MGAVTPSMRARICRWHHAVSFKTGKLLVRGLFPEHRDYGTDFPDDASPGPADSGHLPLVRIALVLGRIVVVRIER